MRPGGRLVTSAAIRRAREPRIRECPTPRRVKPHRWWYVLIALVAFWTIPLALLPSAHIGELATSDPPVTSYMRYESALLGGPLPAHRRYRPLSAISALLSCSVVKAEDRRFFLHHGVDPHSIITAAGHYVAGEPSGGGSTITQQLARNLYLTPERSLSRKAREVLLALQLEAALPKRRILDLYLNSVQWGASVWGVDAAAAYYFGTTSDKLDAFQSSFLAAMLAAPSRAPAGTNADRVLGVQVRVLEQLELSELITGAESFDALLAARQWRNDVLTGVSWHASIAHAAAQYRESHPAARLTTGVPPAALGTCGYERERARENSADLLGAE